MNIRNRIIEYRVLSPDSDAPGVQSGEGGATPTVTLQTGEP